MNSSTIAKAATIAVDPIGAGAGLAVNAATSGVASSVTSAVGGAISSAVSPLVSGLARVGLYVVFVVGGLGLVILAIARLTKGPRQEAEHIVGKTAETAGAVAALA